MSLSRHNFRQPAFKLFLKSETCFTLTQVLQDWQGGPKAELGTLFEINNNNNNNNNNVFI